VAHGSTFALITNRRPRAIAAPRGYTPTATVAVSPVLKSTRVTEFVPAFATYAIVSLTIVTAIGQDPVGKLMVRRTIPSRRSTMTTTSEVPPATRAVVPRPAT